MNEKRKIAISMKLCRQYIQYMVREHIKVIKQCNHISIGEANADSAIENRKHAKTWLKYAKEFEVITKATEELQDRLDSYKPHQRLLNKYKRNEK